MKMHHLDELILVQRDSVFGGMIKLWYSRNCGTRVPTCFGKVFFYIEKFVAWFSPRNASSKIFNRRTQTFDLSPRDSALWDSEKHREGTTRKRSKEYRHFSEVIKVGYDAFGSLDSTYLDPCSDNAAGTIGRKRRSEVLQVELDRRWDQGLACYWWPGPSARR